MRICVLLGAILLSGAGVCVYADGPSRAQSLPRSTPEKQGISSVGLLKFVDALDAVDALHSVLLIRHGQVVMEGWWAPYDPASNHELYSLSKSFTSTAVGLAIAEGRLTLDDPVLKFFPTDAPLEPSANLKAMRVRDLLSMSTGHQDEPPTAADKISAQAFLAAPVPHKPGTHFKYNTAATFMQSAIVQKLTGQSVRDYLQTRLFEPLGITQPVWATNGQGISLGGYGLRVRTEDIAKFGLLYLNHGRWNGKQLVPAVWVEAATAKQVSNGSNPTSDWDQGYGFQFWRCRHGAFRGDGAFGQYCLVLPEQDAVLAITSGVKDMQAVLNVVWDNLLPALQPRRLAADDANLKRLKTRLASLSVAQPAGSATAPLGMAAIGRTFTFPSNADKLEAMTLQSASSGAGWIIVSRVDGVENRIPCGYRQWSRSRGSLGTFRDEPVAASGAWTSDNTFVMKLCGYETPYYVTTQLHFDGDQLVLERAANVGFGGTKPIQWVGRGQ